MQILNPYSEAAGDSLRNIPPVQNVVLFHEYFDGT